MSSENEGKTNQSHHSDDDEGGPLPLHEVDLQIEERHAALDPESQEDCRTLVERVRDRLNALAERTAEKIRFLEF